MAAVKDPTKTSAPIRDKKAVPAAGTESEAPARDDFSFSQNNQYRKAREIQEDLEELELRQAQGANGLREQLDDSEKLLTADDLERLGTFTLSEILRVDPTDLRAMSLRIGEVIDGTTGQKTYMAGSDLAKYEARSAAHLYLGGIGQSGGKSATEFRVTTPAFVQSEVVESINKVSKLTGVPSALLGAMAGIESGFGKNLLSPTGAIGTLQQTGGYRTTMWKTYGDQIAQHVPEARAAMQNGLDSGEMRKLAFNNDAAFMIVALRAKDLAKKYGLDLNDKKSWGIVYLDHNSGEGSVKRLLAGQMTDDTIRGYNPAIYRGLDTADQVLSATQSKMVAYAGAYEKVSAKVTADSVIASASTSAAKVVASAADVRKVDAQGPTPIPT